MIVLGIDPGVAFTGYGIIKSIKNKYIHIDHGCIKTIAKKNFSERLFVIYKKINALIDFYKPNYLAIEDIYFAKNVRSAFLVGQVKGTLILGAKQRNLYIIEMSPLEIKQAIVGYGKADKKQVQKMVQLLLGLKEIPKPHHSADALAVAISSVQKIKFNNLGK